MSCCSNEDEHVSSHTLHRYCELHPRDDPIRLALKSNGSRSTCYHTRPIMKTRENASHDDAMHHDAPRGVPVHWSANDAHRRHRPRSPVRCTDHDGEAHPHRGKPLRGANSPSPQRRSPSPQRRSSSPQRKHRHGEAYHGLRITALPGGGSRTEVSYMLAAFQFHKLRPCFRASLSLGMRMHVKSCIQASLAELPVHMIYLARHIRGLPPPFCFCVQDFLHGNERTVHNGGQYIPTRF